MFAAKKQNRRVFVTTYQLQQQQKKKAIQTRSSLQAVTRKSPRLNKVQATPDRLESEKAVAAKRKLDLPDHSREEEKMGENKLKASEAAAKTSEAAKKASAAAKTSSAPKDSTTANASGAGSVNAEENISPEIEQDEEDEEAG
uniref:Uncharacterized protein n=1 Tax=Daucus carota subsp. sativus TaxID=79200 RepID=A0A164UE18_DAUCS